MHIVFVHRIKKNHKTKIVFSTVSIIESEWLQSGHEEDPISITQTQDVVKQVEPRDKHIHCVQKGFEYFRVKTATASG